MTYPDFIRAVAESDKAKTFAMFYSAGPKIQKCIGMAFFDQMGFIRVDGHKNFKCLRPGDVIIYPPNDFNNDNVSPFHINKWCLDMSNTYSECENFVNCGPGLDSQVFRHAWAEKYIHELFLVQNEVSINFMSWYNNKTIGWDFATRPKSYGNVNFSQPLPLP